LLGGGQGGGGGELLNILNIFNNLLVESTSNIEIFIDFILVLRIRKKTNMKITYRLWNLWSNNHRNFTLSLPPPKPNPGNILTSHFSWSIIMFNFTDFYSTANYTMLYSILYIKCPPMSINFNYQFINFFQSFVYLYIWLVCTVQFNACFKL